MKTFLRVLIVGLMLTGMGISLMLAWQPAAGSGVKGQNFPTNTPLTGLPVYRTETPGPAAAPVNQPGTPGGTQPKDTAVIWPVFLIGAVLAGLVLVAVFAGYKSRLGMGETEEESSEAEKGLPPSDKPRK